ncbi:MAG: preprotein translocase subunit SecG [Bacteroidales bacterium]|nr:preprotein translocase subunit SecG [Bacteroidales bacterium]
MNAIFAILITIAAVLLIGVVLIQKSKGGGLAANVSNYNQIAGVRKTTDFVEKATWSLAIFICVLSICACIFAKSSDANQGTRLATPQTEQQQGTGIPTSGQDQPAAPAKK